MLPQKGLRAHPPCGRRALVGLIQWVPKAGVWGQSLWDEGHWREVQPGSAQGRCGTRGQSPGALTQALLGPWTGGGSCQSRHACDVHRPVSSGNPEPHRLAVYCL